MRDIAINTGKSVMKNNLLKKISDKSATVGIIGLGYVGLPLVIRFSEEKFKVIGFDIDTEKCQTLNSGESYIRHINAEFIQIALKNGFTATSSWEKISEVDCMLICVPTPLGINNTPNLQYIYNTLKSICEFLKKGQLLILESTTYPGTTDEELVPVVENQGFQIGEDFFIAYSPEREDPGNPKYSTRTIPFRQNCHPNILPSRPNCHSNILPFRKYCHPNILPLRLINTTSTTPTNRP